MGDGGARREHPLNKEASAAAAHLVEGTAEDKLQSSAAELC